MPKFMIVGGIGALFTLIGLFMIKQDIRLRIWGKQAEATIDSAWMDGGLSLRSRKRVKVGYTYFHEERGMLKGSFFPPSGWEPPADLKLKITYLPYAPHVARTEFDSTLWPYLFTLFGLILLGVGVWQFFTESVVESHRASSTPNPHGKLGRAIDRLTDTD